MTSTDDAGLAALELRRPDGWQDEVKRILQSRGMHVTRRGSLLATWHTGLKRIHATLRFAEGYVIGRVKLAPGRSALGISPRRLYFDETEKPLRQPERKILGGRRKPGTTTDVELLSSTVDLLHHIASVEHTAFGTLVKLPAPTTRLEDRCEVAVGTRKVSARDLDLNKLYRDGGFDSVPEGFGVRIVPFQVSTQQAETVADNLRRKLKDRQMVRPDVRVVHPQRVAARLDALDSGSPKRDPTPAVLLLLLRASGEPVPEQCRSLMEGLDRNSLQWRRAYGDDPIEYSIPDQLPSILQAAGGRPHRTLLADGTRLPWLIGIDLSHKWEADESTLCISLVDPDGLLQGAWCSRHSRNEQIDGARLRPLLRLAAQVVEERDDEPRILVVRDGRLFEGEDHRAYLELLGAASSLVECIKGGNPQLFLSTARGAQLPDRAMWAAVPNACSGFLVPFPQRSRKALDRVLKIRCRPEWDGLGLGATGVAECLMASTFAPGLGLKRRTLPAPIYWADGIAGADDSDLRFRGQRVVFVE